MYYDDYSEESYRFFNAYMVKMAYDFNPEETKKRFKNTSLDRHPIDVFFDCFRAIAPGTRVYTRDRFERVFDWGLDYIIILKSPSIKQIYDLLGRMKQNKDKNPTLAHYYESVKSSLHVGYDWLAYLEKDCGAKVRLLKGDEGIINRMRIENFVPGEAEILKGVIEFLTWVESGLKKVLSNPEIRRMVYAEL